MEVKITITDDQGKVQELKGDAILFHILEPRNEEEGSRAGATGIVGNFSAVDIGQAQYAINGVIIKRQAEQMKEAIKETICGLELKDKSIQKMMEEAAEKIVEEILRKKAD